MWCCEVVSPRHATPAVIPSVYGTSWRRRHSVSANANAKQKGGKLGDSLVATLESKSSPIPKAQQEGEISGSDILWALQRASANRKKNKKNKKDNRRGSSSVATPTEEAPVDYTSVRPLRINSNWLAQLDDLDKRLRQLSDNI